MLFSEATCLTKPLTWKGSWLVRPLDVLDVLDRHDRLDHAVPQGPVTAHLGPHCARKITAVIVLTILTSPTSARARNGGIDVLAHPERIRPIIAVSGRFDAVDENLTGFENLDVVRSFPPETAR